MLCEIKSANLIEKNCRKYYNESNNAIFEVLVLKKIGFDNEKYVKM